MAKIGERQVTFRSGDHDLVGALIEHSDVKPVDGIIICHGLHAHHNWRWIPSMAQSIAQRLTVTVLRFDFAGCGASQGQWRFGAYIAQSHDIVSACTFLVTSGITPRAVIGHSMGANAALLFASLPFPYPVQHIVSISGSVRSRICCLFTAINSRRYRMERGIYEMFTEAQMNELEQTGEFCWRVRDKAFIVASEDIRDRQQLGMDNAACSIPASTNVLIVHGANDEVVHVDDSKALNAAIISSELIELKSADHCFTSGAHQALIDCVVVWLQVRLSVMTGNVDKA